MSKRIMIVVILALGMLSAATGGWQFSKFAYASTTSAKGQPVGLVVIEAPENFAQDAALMGFTISDKLFLKELDMVTYRFLAPMGMTSHTAEEKLSDHFPGIIVENAEIDMSPSAADSTEFNF